MIELPIIARAIAHANRVAIEADGQRYSYQDLLNGSFAVASALLEKSADLAEARIGFLVPAGFDYVRMQWGIWRAGGIAVPLSLSATPQELAYTLADSQTSVVLTTQALLDKLRPLCHERQIELLTIEHISVASTRQLPQVDINRRAMILYTSGTTSHPKGVVSTHICIQAQIESLIDAWEWQADDRIPLFLPLHHIHGIINILSCALWAGATIDTFPRFDLELIFRQVADRAYTVFMAVPTIYVKLIEAIEALPTQQREAVIAGFRAMRLMVSGSAALPASVHEKWSQLTGQKLLERYGMTEIGMALSNPYHGERRPGAVGQPLPRVEIRLVTDDGSVINTMDLSNQNLPGEIQVRGPNVFSEYWNRKQATDESFQEGWFRTGDIAIVENGYFRILGRSSVDIIKSGGYKLSALEIEAALLDHPAIGECAVIGLPDDTWGEIVAAAVVLKFDMMLSLDELRAWCSDRISHYKLPRRLLSVRQLPRNAMGKVTKPAVHALFVSESAGRQVIQPSTESI